jgi:hypothetical protein
MWERNRRYSSKNKCLVCGSKTTALAAPLGIVSGVFPCCMSHPDAEVVDAYLKWCAEQEPPTPTPSP